MAAMECLRDIGLEECVNIATKDDCMEHTRWCHSMTGEEWARIYSWGNDPRYWPALTGSLLMDLPAMGGPFEGMADEGGIGALWVC
jgi:hypothetical protein